MGPLFLRSFLIALLGLCALFVARAAYCTTAPVDGRLSALSGATTKASDVIFDIGKDGVALALATNPLFVGQKDARLGVVNVAGYPYNARCDGSTDDTKAITAANTAAALADGAIYIPPSANGCTIGTATISVPVVSDGGTFTLTTGQTTTFTKAIIAPRGLLFRNALNGQGTVSFTGNPALDQIYPQWWGAVGDGNADNYAAFLAAGKTAIAAGISLKVGKGNYKINNFLVFDGALRLFGDGENTILDFSSITNVGGTLITIRGALGAVTTTLRADKAKGETVLSVVSSNNFKAGDRIQITSNEAFSPTDSNYKKGELAYITSTGSGTLTISTGLKDNYATAPEVVTITKINGITDPRVESVKILGGGAARRQHAIDVFYAVGGYFSKVFIDQCEDTGISLAYSDTSIIENCHARDMRGTANGVGYAFALDLLTQNSTVRGCTTENVSSGFSTGGYLPVWNSVVSDNRFQNGTSLRGMIQTHANGANTIITNNTLINGLIGIGTQGPGMTARGNFITGMSYAGINVGEDGAVNLRVTGNTISSYRGISVGPSAAGGAKASIIISDNDLTGTPTHAVAAGLTCGANATIKSNRIRNHSPGILLIEGKNSRIEDNEIIDTRNDNQPYGIYLYSNALVDGIIVHQNRIRSEIPSETTYSLLISAGVIDTTVTKNVFKDVLAAYVSDGGTRTVIRENIFDGDIQEIVVANSAGATNGTTAGRARTSATVNYQINGKYFSKASTDDLWNLSAVTTGAAEYMKVVLCLDKAGNGFIVQGVKSSAQTTARVPTFIPPDKAPVAIVEIPNNYAGGPLAGFKFHNLTGRQ